MTYSHELGFQTRLRTAVARSRTSLCVGIDAHTANLPSFFARELARDTARYLETFAFTLIDAAASRVPAVKLQSAFFEAFGAAGFGVLQKALARARAAGLVTILDAKRGDIASTMAAYGHMAFEVMAADCLTVTPYMGLDVVQPLEPWLARGSGIYVVWVSSNPGGALVQDMRAASPEGSQTVAEALLKALIRNFEQRGLVEALGLVLGATRVDTLPEHILLLLEKAALLLPGVGAQGGVVTPRTLALIRRQGTALVPQSRSLSRIDPEMESWEAYADCVVARIEKEAAALAFVPSP